MNFCTLIKQSLLQLLGYCLHQVDLNLKMFGLRTRGPFCLLHIEFSLCVFTLRVLHHPQKSVTFSVRSWPDGLHHMGCGVKWGRKDNSCNISPPCWRWKEETELWGSFYSMFCQSAAPRWTMHHQRLEQDGRSAGWSPQTPMCLWRSCPPICLFHWRSRNGPLSWTLEGLTTSRAPNKEGPAGWSALSFSVNIPQVWERQRKSAGEEKGSGWILQPYMDKALLFPGFGTLTSGMVPDADPTAPWCHQEVQPL